MNKASLAILFCITLATGCVSPTAVKTAKPGKQATAPDNNPVVVISTSLGDMEVKLQADKAPISVANFLTYSDAGFFNGTIFHRVIQNFMIQGGGFDEKMQEKITRAPIQNEAANGLLNKRGTLAMARTQQINSATAQFFINLQDNTFLNHGARDFGYAVFGEVISGMDVVDKIAAVPTGTRGQFENVPTTPVLIKSVKRK